MLAMVLSAFKIKVTGPCYISGDKNDVIEAYKAEIPAILKFKGDHAFLIDDYLTYVDFYFFELLE